MEEQRIMNENQIIELFWQRDHTAIDEVSHAYHGLLYHIAKNIAPTKEDADECVNDTYLKLWNAIPPERPDSLKNYAARITRNLAIDAYRRNKERMKNMELSEVCEELESVLPGTKSEYENVEWKELINHFLENLEPETRKLFVRRYWQAESIKELAELFDLKESAIKMRLSRTRKEFQKYLKQEGIPV